MQANHTVATQFPIVPSRSLSRIESSCRPRNLSFQQGRALEILGHAIEYLGDEYALQCRNRDVNQCGHAGPVLAIELLMARSREIYFSAAPVPTLKERLTLWLGLVRS